MRTSPSSDQKTEREFPQKEDGLTLQRVRTPNSSRQLSFRFFYSHSERVFRGALIFAVAITFTHCSLLSTRPVQNMANTQAAIRAAKEVQADVLAPELYRQANEWFHRAREEYKMKNFSEANEFADKARAYAERAEFEAIRNGANRKGIEPGDPLANEVEPPSPLRHEPNVYATPTGTPIEQFDQPSTPPTKP